MPVVMRLSVRPTGLLQAGLDAEVRGRVGQVGVAVGIGSHQGDLAGHRAVAQEIVGRDLHPGGLAGAHVATVGGAQACFDDDLVLVGHDFEDGLAGLDHPACTRAAQSLDEAAGGRQHGGARALGPGAHQVFAEAGQLAFGLGQFVGGAAAEGALGLLQLGLGLLDLGAVAEQRLARCRQLGADLLQRPLLVQHFQLADQLFGGELPGNGGFLLVQAQIGLQPLDAGLDLGHVAARLLQLGLGRGNAALVFQRAGREGAQLGLDHLRVQVGRETGALQRPALAFRAQPYLDRLGRGHARRELLEVEAVAAQVDFQQRLALGHGLAFAHMDGGDDAAFQMLHGLHAVGRDDLAAGDHHVLHRIEQAGDHQGGDGNDEQPFAPRQGGAARGGGVVPDASAGGWPCTAACASLDWRSTRGGRRSARPS